MTVVAWRSGVLAADTLAMNGLKTRQSKLRRLSDGRIMGFAGTLVDCIEFVRWLNSDVDELPDWLRDAEHTALVIDGDGTPHVYQSGCGPIDIGEEYVAIGCGAHVAYGAMYMGGTAEDAVRAAIQWDGGCGGEVETMRLSCP